MTLEEKYDAAVRALLRKTGDEVKGYYPSRTVSMVDRHGAVEAAKRIVLKSDYSVGFTALWEAGRLDLSIEQHLRDNPEFHPLFDAQIIEQCQKTLDDYKKPPRES